MLEDYFILFFFVVVSSLLSFVILGLSYFLANQHSEDGEKLSVYECGFDPFDNARHKFDVRFYLVAILFLVFDLEISFLFPWALCISKLSFFSFFSMFFFLFILTVGFVYEWISGALEWELQGYRNYFV